MIMYEVPLSIFVFKRERKNRIKYRLGMSIKNSAMRIMVQSVVPPKYPEMPPKRTASKNEMSVATKPIVSEILLPYTIRLNKSLPR